jgi:hypothetical protein
MTVRDNTRLREGGDQVVLRVARPQPREGSEDRALVVLISRRKPSVRISRVVLLWADVI